MPKKTTDNIALECGHEPKYNRTGPPAKTGDYVLCWEYGCLQWRRVVEASELMSGATS